MSDPIPTVDDIEAAGGFPLVYADPAWAYKQQGRGVAENHYPTMSLAAIQALPVGRIAARDAVLFLWGTWPQLPAVLETIDKWGFVYKTCGFLWVKYRSAVDIKHVGGGFWTRANTEFCLVGVRGKNHPKRVDKAVRQLIESTGDEKVLLAPLQEHSAKPPEARERIVELMGDLPRVELFARERVPGWFAWGNDPALGAPDFEMHSDENVGGSASNAG